MKAFNLSWTEAYLYNSFPLTGEFIFGSSELDKNESNALQRGVDDIYFGSRLNRLDSWTVKDLKHWRDSIICIKSTS